MGLLDAILNETPTVQLMHECKFFEIVTCGIFLAAIDMCFLPETREFCLDGTFRIL